MRYVPSRGAEVLAVSGRGQVAALRFRDSLTYGVQFHPEVRHTRKGMVLLRNFLRLAGVKLTWRPANILEEVLEKPLGAHGGFFSSSLTALPGKPLSELLRQGVIGWGADVVS